MTKNTDDNQRPREPSAAQVAAKGRAVLKAACAVLNLDSPLKAVMQTWRLASTEDQRRIKAWVLEQEMPVSDSGGGGKPFVEKKGV